MDLNPYEAPRSVESDVVRSVNPLAGLRGPSVGLLLLSEFSAFSGTIAALNLVAVAVLVLLFGVHGRRMQSIDQVVMIALLISGISSIFIFRGAMSMRSGKWYRSALGIWALIVLRRPAVRAAFRS